MKYLIAAIIASFSIALVCERSSKADEQHNAHQLDATWLQSNNFLSLGPAVIKSSKRIDLHLNEVDAFKVVAGDKNFSSILNWVFDNCYGKLVTPPNNKNFKFGVRPNHLILYASERARIEDGLIQIDLDSKILNADEQSFKTQMEELKQKMAPYMLDLPTQDRYDIHRFMVLSADDDWVDTRMSVSPYNTVSVSIKSEDADCWTIASNPACGIGGVEGKQAGSEYVLPMAPPGCLLGKIGSGKPFILRSGTVNLPQNLPGELYIRANIDENDSQRNSGTIRITLCGRLSRYAFEK